MRARTFLALMGAKEKQDNSLPLDDAERVLLETYADKLQEPVCSVCKESLGPRVDGVRQVVRGPA